MNGRDIPNQCRRDILLAFHHLLHVFTNEEIIRVKSWIKGKWETAITDISNQNATLETITNNMIVSPTKNETRFCCIDEHLDEVNDITLFLHSESDEQLYTWEIQANNNYDVEQLQRYMSLLLNIQHTTNPTTLLSQLTLLHEEDKNLIEKNYFSESRPLSMDLLHHLVDKSIAEHPHNLAILYKGNTITYKELDCLVNDVVFNLTRKYKEIPERVATCVHEGPDRIVVQLALMHLGSVFIPFDPHVPFERTKLMIQDSKVNLVILSSEDWSNMKDNLAQLTPTVDYLCMELLKKNRQTNTKGGGNSPPPKIQRKRSTTSKIQKENPICYAIYTSGSTGQPKGVLISHASIVNYVITRAQWDGIDATSRVLISSAFTFDPSIGDSFAALIQGAAVCLESRNKLTFHFAQCLKESQASHLSTTPALLSTIELKTLDESSSSSVLTSDNSSMAFTVTSESLHAKGCFVGEKGDNGEISSESLHGKDCFVGEKGGNGEISSESSHVNVLSIGKKEEEEEEEFPHLKVVSVGGEQMPQSLAKAWGINRTWQLINTYGVTEVTVYQTVSSRRSWMDTNCIGHPLPNVEIFILSKWLRPVPIGAIGEIYLGGVQVGLGYMNAPDLSKHKFLNRPSHLPPPLHTTFPKLYRTGDLGKYISNGDIVFLGRTDFQLNINGYRIESGEIEEILSKCPLIKSCCVIGMEGKLSCAVTLLESLMDQNMDDLLVATKLYCGYYLPNYMIPQDIYFVPELPLTSSGKYDRVALKKFIQDNILQTLHGKSQSLYVPPTTSTEKLVAPLWEQVLSNSQVRVGKMDNFFLTGGDSLKALRLINILNKKIGNTSKIIGNTSKVIGNTSKIIRNTSKIIGNTSKIIGNTSKIIGNTTDFLLPQTLFQHSTLSQFCSFLDNHASICAYLRKTNELNNDFLPTTQVTGAKNEVSGADDKVSGAEHEVSGGENKVSGGENKVSGGENKVSGGEHEGRSPSMQALYHAASSGCVELLEVLIHCGVDPNGDPQKNHRFPSPLHQAAFKGHSIIVQHLLDAGANINIKNQELQTPLHLAASVSWECTFLLLENNKGAMKSRDVNQQLPVHFAARAGKCDVLQYFLKHVPDVMEVRDKWQRTPLHWCVLHGHHQAVKLLLNAGVTANPPFVQGRIHRRLTNNKQETPLHIAVQNVPRDGLDILDLLLTHGANPHCSDSNGQTPSDLIATLGSESLKAILFQKLVPTYSS